MNTAARGVRAPLPSRHNLTITQKENRQMMEPPMQLIIAIGVLALLLCLRRRRTGNPQS